MPPLLPQPIEESDIVKTQTIVRELFIDLAKDRLADGGRDTTAIVANVTRRGHAHPSNRTYYENHEDCHVKSCPKSGRCDSTIHN